MIEKQYSLSYKINSGSPSIIAPYLLELVVENRIAAATATDLQHPHVQPAGL